jgi:hypothetical protein
MASNISILIQAKDQASATVSKLSKSISANVGAMADQVKSALNTASVALGAVGVGLTAYSKQSLDYTTQLVGTVKALTRQTGLTTEEGSRLSYVLQRMGLDAGATTSIFNFFAKKIADTEGPLKDLGINTQDASGKQRGFRDILLDVADKFASMPDGVAKSTLALDIFGRQGASMVKVLNNGRAGIEELEKTADNLGVTLTDKTVNAVLAYSRSQKDLAESTGGLKLQVGALTAPVLTELNNTLLSLTQRVIGTDSPLKTAIVNVIAFGGPVATAAAAMLGFIANLSTINGGLGSFAGLALGAAVALIGSGGLFIVLSQFMGLNFAPLRASLDHLFDAFLKSAGDSATNLGKFADSPAWQKVKGRGNDIIVKLAESIDRVTKALTDGGLSAGIQQIGAEFGKIDVQGIIIAVIGKMADFPWEEHSQKMMEGMLRLLSALAARTAEFVALATPDLLKMAMGIIDGLVRGIFTYAIENPIDFAMLLLMLGFLPAKVLAALGGLLAKIPIVGPFISWILTSLGAVGDFLLTPVKALFGRVGTKMVEGIKGGWDDAIGWLRGVVDGGLAGIRGAAEGAFNFVRNINWGEAIKAAGKGIGNSVIGLIEGGINGALKGLPGSPKINIPRFYKGVQNFGGGLAVVGDINGRGGEVLNLPRGTDVIPNAQAKEMLGGGRSIEIVQHIHNEIDMRNAISEIGWKLRTAS